MYDNCSELSFWKTCLRRTALADFPRCRSTTNKAYAKPGLCYLARRSSAPADTSWSGSNGLKERRSESDGSVPIRKLVDLLVRQNSKEELLAELLPLHAN